ncbi:MAG TPA: cell division protein FtsL [Pseudomonadales bacterium]|nr:cell division protein FtsL [Pseudomonadales bacterium]
MTRRLIVGQTRPTWQWIAVAGAIYVGIAASGVCVAAVAQDVRGLFVALAKNQGRQDELLAQYSRLLIERGTLSSYQNVDQAAERQLAMRFPETVERIAP